MFRTVSTVVPSPDAGCPTCPWRCHCFILPFWLIACTALLLLLLLHLIELINGTFHIHHLSGCIFFISFLYRFVFVLTYPSPRLAHNVEKPPLLIAIVFRAVACFSPLKFPLFTFHIFLDFFSPRINELQNSIENR